MIEAKKKNVSIFIQPTKLTGDVAVCLSMNLKVNGCCINKLYSGLSCKSHPSGLELSNVAYAMYLNVNHLLCGDPLAMKSSKVGNTVCGSHNGMFFISWKVKGTISAVRKSLGIALKGLTPGKLYSSYQQINRSLNLTPKYEEVDGEIEEVVGSAPNREEFNWAAQEIISSIKNNGVCCGVVGNINLGKTASEHGKKVDEMLDVLVKKLNPGEVSGKKTKPQDGKSCNHDEAVIKVSGWSAYLLKDYIMAKARGVVPVICDKEIIVPVKKSSWDSLSSKLKAAASDYVKLRYSKVGKELGNVMAYLAISNGSVSCVDVKSLLKGVTTEQVTSAIKSAL